MKEINIGKMIIEKRKEKGLTQDALASYMGVSKASVSKWETGQSYPDIVFLPQLAAYFNISIDDLIGYEPQMVKEDIVKVYQSLAKKFAERPFLEVLQECRSIIKKYYSCFPLLLQMCMILINHVELTDDDEQRKEIMTEAKELCMRIRHECEDFSICKQANYMEAVCCLQLKEAEECKELLKDVNDPMVAEEVFLATAFSMTGDIQKAKETLQIGIFRHIIGLLNDLVNYLQLYTDDMDKFEEILSRTLQICEAFHMKELQAGTVSGVYAQAACGFVSAGEKEKALDMLEQYTEIVTGDIFPIEIKGDEFFDKVDEWIGEYVYGSKPPRDEETIKKSFARMIIENPVFESLKAEKRFQKIEERLKCLSEIM